MTNAYLINRLPSRVLKFKSPMEVLKGRKIELSHLRVFGCTSFVHIQPHHRDKLDPWRASVSFLVSHHKKDTSIIAQNYRNLSCQKM